MRKRLPYNEGTWFAVPLANGGYSLGLVARAPVEGRVLYGYFFGPRRIKVPTLSEIRHLKSDDALKISFFGDLALMKGTWPVIGRIEPWNRDSWPMREFLRTDSISGQKYKVQYSDDGTNRELGILPSTSDEVDRLPKDGVAGTGVIESTLDSLLGPMSEAVH